MEQNIVMPSALSTLLHPQKAVRCEQMLHHKNSHDDTDVYNNSCYRESEHWVYAFQTDFDWWIQRDINH